jgi:hypothetical protein
MSDIPSTLGELPRIYILRRWVNRVGSRAETPDRHQELPGGEEPPGVQQEERPDQERRRGDNPTDRGAYLLPPGLEPGHEPPVLAARHRGEEQDKRGLAYGYPDRVRDGDRPEGLPPPGDHHQRVEGRVEDRHEGEEDREGEQGERAGPPGRARLGRVGGRPPCAREAPGHEHQPQGGLDEGPWAGEEPAPVEVGNARAHGQRERRPEGRGTEARDEAERYDVAFAGPGGEGPGREERARGVQPGQPEPQRGEQEPDNPGRSPLMPIPRE